MGEAYLVLLGDIDTNTWHLHTQVDTSKKANKIFEDMRQDGTPCLVINPADFFNGYPE